MKIELTRHELEALLYFTGRTLDRGDHRDGLEETALDFESAATKLETAYDKAEKRGEE